jgi:hypothetical protein
MPSPASMVKLMKALGLKTDDLIRASDPQAVEAINAKLSRKGGKPTEQDVFQEIARLNAAMPVQQGGLGMGVRNTAQERARGLGFDTPVYRGQDGSLTGVVVKRAPKNEQLNLASVHVAERPEFANIYAGENESALLPLLMRRGDITDATALINKDSQEFEMLKSLLPRGQKPYLSRGGAGLPSDPMVAPPLQSYIDAAGPQKAEKVFAGKDAIKYQAKYGNMGAPGQGMTVSAESPSYAVLKPELLRSRFAAFDPARVNENNLLASRLLPFALPGLLALPTDEE